jgi:hypothetical protein
MHAADKKFTKDRYGENTPKCVNWNLRAAMQHAANLPSPITLHVGLHPQPFIGNVESALILILLGNPGFDFRDYYDEFVNKRHSSYCARNLRNDCLGFFPLHDMAPASGASYYWRRAFFKTIKAIGASRGINEPAARELLRKHVGLIESCAYHSGKTPGLWTDELPSSRTARLQAQRAFTRARNGDSLVIVWRRVGKDDYWKPGRPHRNILCRNEKQAQNKHILASETKAIVKFLNQRIPPKI